MVMKTYEKGKDSLSPVIDDIIQRLVQAYEPERIYLFGSVARGDMHPDSDYDFMLIVGDNAPSARRRSRLAYQVLRGTGMAIDVLVWTKSEFEARLHLKASFPSTVVSEGKLIYAS